MKDRSNDSAGVSRRGFLTQTAGVAGATLLTSAAASAATAPSKKGMPEIRGDGTYPTVPLRSDTVTVGLLQTRVTPVEAKNGARDVRANVEHMCFAIDAAQYYGIKKDLLVFHEFPITGWAKWTRKEIMSFAPEIPGPEIAPILDKAREHNCYVSFGTYARDADWPGHVISMSVIVSPEGKVISRQWKHRNIHGAFAEFELFTSTVYDVLDRYVEMYGWDAVIPVARTDIGNLCISPCQWEPELYRAMAVKGGEFLIRTATGGATPDMQIYCRVNNVYGALVNNAISPTNRYFLEATGGGGSAIYDPHGKVIASASQPVEDCIEARIPMAEYRKRHRTPDVYKALYTHVLDRPEVRFEPGAFLEHLPETLEESGRYFRTKAKW